MNRVWPSGLTRSPLAAGTRSALQSNVLMSRRRSTYQLNSRRLAFSSIAFTAAHGNLPGAPVPIRLDNFRWETLEVGQGVIVGKLGWEQVLELNKQSYLGVYSDGADDRFTSAYPTSMTPATFVDALFENSEVTPSASDRAAAINEF